MNECVSVIVCVICECSSIVSFVFLLYLYFFEEKRDCLWENGKGGKMCVS